MEEWAELTAYWCMVSIAFVTGFRKRPEKMTLPDRKLFLIRHL
ncbi:MAG: hypothetical protein ABFC84_17550 [Veillonellales bacterium]